MSSVTENLMSCLGSHSVILRKTTVHILQIYLRFSSDVQAVIRYLSSFHRKLLIKNIYFTLIF